MPIFVTRYRTTTRLIYTVFKCTSVSTGGPSLIFDPIIHYFGVAITNGVARIWCEGGMKLRVNNLKVKHKNIMKLRAAIQ